MTFPIRTPRITMWSFPPEHPQSQQLFRDFFQQNAYNHSYHRVIFPIWTPRIKAVIAWSFPPEHQHLQWSLWSSPLPLPPDSPHPNINHSNHCVIFPSQTPTVTPIIVWSSPTLTSTITAIIVWYLFPTPTFTKNHCVILPTGTHTITVIIAQSFQSEHTQSQQIIVKSFQLQHPQSQQSLSDLSHVNHRNNHCIIFPTCTSMITTIITWYFPPEHLRTLISLMHVATTHHLNYSKQESQKHKLQFIFSDTPVTLKQSWSSKLQWQCRPWGML